MIGIIAAAGVKATRNLSETVPPPQLPELIVVAAWVAFSTGLVLAFNAEPGVLLVADSERHRDVLAATGATLLAGSVVGTLVAGAALGAFVTLVGTHPHRPPRLSLLLGGFFVLIVGGAGTAAPPHSSSETWYPLRNPGTSRCRFPPSRWQSQLG